MVDEVRSPGKTTIAPEVLLNIARLTTLHVKGVSHMSPQHHVNEIFQRGQRSDGVRVQIHENTVTIDIYVVLNSGVNIRQVSREIQEDVARAITEMVGMEAGQINIHIEDIYFENKED